MSSIGIEICHSLTPGNPRYKQSEENGAKLAALILYELNWGIDRIRKHQDWSGKYCPHRILDNGDWDNFKAKVQNYLNQLKTGAGAPENNTNNNMEEEDMFFVRLEEDLNSKRTKGQIYLFNPAARTHKLLNGDEYNSAKTFFLNAKIYKATKAVNSFLCSDFDRR
nr:hypothetical protein [Streptococcus cuniculi]